MAGSRKRRSADLGAQVARFLQQHALAGTRIAVGLSGGVDSVVLLHAIKQSAAKGRFSLRAVHVHHDLSPNADAWAAFCRRLCRRWKVPFAVRRVRVKRDGRGLEAAARAARYSAMKKTPVEALCLAHNLDDQAETVLMNLLRGAGRAGARGMPAAGRLDGKRLLRPLLDVSRDDILGYAEAQGLEWIEDESNADESLTRNFVRRRLGPLIATRFPRWREALARSARHFASREAGSQDLLRAFLASRGLRAPSEARLIEMLKQLTARGARTLVEHDGVRLRAYRGMLSVERALPEKAFAPLRWEGERRLAIPALGGEMRFRRARGRGIDRERIAGRPLVVRLRSGGERLRPDAGRPRRTLKNLFQEAGVPPWQRDRLPLLYRGEELVWVPGIGIEASYQARAGLPGVVPEWRGPDQA